MGNVGQGVGQENLNLSNADRAIVGNAATANGSTDTITLRFTAANTVNTGGMATIAEEATLGTIITVVQAGLWWINLSSNDGAVDMNIGIGINAAAAGALTTEPDNFDAVDAGAGTEGIVALAGDTNIAADGPHLLNCSIMRYMIPGDTIRFYATVAATAIAAGTRFNCVLVSPT